MDKFCEDCVHNEVCQYYAIPPHKDRCNDKDTLDDIFPMEIVAGKCPIEAGGNCPLKQQGEWVRKEDIIHLLERWSDGYSYIEIPTETAIKTIKELKGGAE